jgi:hypothetical protein
LVFLTILKVVLFRFEFISNNLISTSVIGGRVKTGGASMRDSRREVLPADCTNDSVVFLARRIIK